MRIIAGRCRGLTLAALGKGDAAAHLRPTSDRTRESLFNLLAHRGVIEGAHVLDLFAGTGALGLEALSRGAKAVTFVENGRKSLSLLAENIRRTKGEDTTRVHRGDATRLGANPQATAHDLVFLDPPYGKGMGEKALSAALAAGWIAPDALIVWEESAPQTAPVGYVTLEHRRYGDTHVTLLETGHAP